MIALDNGEKWMTSANRVSDFSLHETECHCGCGFNNVEQGLIDALQAIRDYLGEPVKINCALRCNEHNEKVGGTKNSYHMQGKAADIAVFDESTGNDMQSEKLFDAIEFLVDVPFILRYEGRHFCHIDIREGGGRMTCTKEGVYVPIV